MLRTSVLTGVHDLEDQPVAVLVLLTLPTMLDAFDPALCAQAAQHCSAAQHREGSDSFKDLGR
jgi:hypothetical protein